MKRKFIAGKLFLSVLMFLLAINASRIHYFGFELIQETVIKALVLFVLIVFLIVSGIRKRLNIPIFVAFILLLVSCILHNDYFLFFNSFVGFSLSWLLLNIRWKYPPEDILIFISSVSLLSVFFGVLLYLAGDSICRIEISGACRLQGGLTPAHLGFLCFYGVVASCIRIIDYQKGYLLLVINLLICLLTFSRMASALSLISIFSILYLLIKSGEAKHLKIMAFWGGIPLALFSVWSFIHQFVIRSGEDDSGRLSTSGREIAWDYFISAGLNKPWLGHGFGSSLKLTESTSSHFFKVPHNEFIHYFYDLGVVGVISLFLTFTWVFYKIIKKVNTPSRAILKLFALQIILYSLTDNVFSTIQSTLLIALLLTYFNHSRKHEN